MSRGHGHVQRTILAAIRDGATKVEPVDAARLAYDTDTPTRAQLVAVRRAMHRLADEGHVSIGGLSASMASRPQWIYAAPPRTDADRRADDDLGKRLAAIGAGVPQPPRALTCERCGSQFRAELRFHREDSPNRPKYCSSACRQAAYRERRGETWEQRFRREHPDIAARYL